MKRRTIVQGLSTLALALAAGCEGNDSTDFSGLQSNGGGGSGPPPPQNNEVDAVQQRLMETIHTFRGTLDPEDRSGSARQMADFLRQQGLNGVSLSENGLTVSAHFPDGEPFRVLFNTFFTTPDAPVTPLQDLDPAVLGGEPPGPIDTIDPFANLQPPANKELTPSKGEAVVLEMFPLSSQIVQFVSSAIGGTVDSAALVTLLSDAGFHTTHYRSASLQDLRTGPWTDKTAEALFLFTHGSNGGGKDVPSGSPDAQYILTTHQQIGNLAADKERDPLLGADVAARRVLKAHIPYFQLGLKDNQNSGWFYAISTSFVRQYWQLAPHAFVYSGACLGAVDPDFAKALFEKGVSRYMAWDESVLNPIAHRASRYLVDRMCGLNSFGPVQPLQRPFVLEEVLSVMSRAKLGTTPVDLTRSVAQVKGPDGLTQDLVARLRLIYADAEQDSFENLIPTIKSINIERESDGERRILLSLFGALGHPELVVRQGAVTLPRVPSTNSSVKVAVAQPGPIRARIGTRLKSNQKSLCRWRIPLAFTQKLSLGDGFAFGAPDGGGLVTYELLLEALFFYNTYRPFPEADVDNIVPVMDGLLTANATCRLKSASGQQTVGNRQYKLELNGLPRDFTFSLGAPSSQQADGTFGVGLDLALATTQDQIGFNFGSLAKNVLKITETNLSNGNIRVFTVDHRMESVSMVQLNTVTEPLRLTFDEQFDLAGATFGDQFHLGRTAVFQDAPREGPHPRADPRL